MKVSTFKSCISFQQITVYYRNILYDILKMRVVSQQPFTLFLPALACCTSTVLLQYLKKNATLQTINLEIIHTPVNCTSKCLDPRSGVSRAIAATFTTIK